MSEIVRLRGKEIEGCWEELAALRIRVFREFPYLYEGSMDYERRYLETYWRSPDSLVVVVRDEGRAVGATTALPLAHESKEFQKPFLDHGWNVRDYFYLGESVLLPEFRGRGFGHTFFDEREAHAVSLRYPHTCFCAVERPADHPLRPADYRSLEPFWRKRGYLHHPELRAFYLWQDVGDSEETAKPMSFWVR